MKNFLFNLFTFEEGTSEGVIEGNELAEQIGYQAEEDPIAEGDDGEVSEEEPTEEEDLDSEFEELIKGKFKDQYSTRVKKTIDKRFKNQEANNAELEGYKRLAAVLSAKYDVDEEDPYDIIEALESDERFYEDEALEAGMSTEQYAMMKQLERKNAQYEREVSEAKERAEVEEIYNDWNTQAEELKEIYPEFDLEEEAEDERFVALLENGVNVQDAYELCHKEEFIKRLKNEAKQDVAETIARNGRRPSENGSKTNMAVSTKIDPSKLTRKQIEQISKDVLRGKKIKF